MSFEKRAREMGLVKMSEQENVFMYVDRFCRVFYKQTKVAKINVLTGNPILDENGQEMNEVLPFYGVSCTEDKDSNKEHLGGFVSDHYKFVGNETIVERAKASILETNAPIMGEFWLMNSPRNTRFEYRFGIQHGGQNIPEIGEIIPQITLNNSYDGTGTEKLAFGLFFTDETNKGTHITFRTKLGSFSQIHTARAKTRLAGILGSFFEIFSENIGDVVNSSVAKTLSEDEILGTLSLVEKLAGKKRREDISVFFHELTAGGNSMSAWHLFLAIAKFSAIEQNLNMKVIMEDIAERVLVLPVRMMEALKKA